MTPETLAAIRSRLAAATPGPWSIKSRWCERGRDSITGIDIAFLLAEIDRLTEDNARLKELYQTLALNSPFRMIKK